MILKGKHHFSINIVSPINYKRLFIGMGILILGIAVYLVERPHDSAVFIRYIPFDLGFLRQFGGPLKPLSGFLPDLTHICGFILLTGALTPQNRVWDMGICLGWFVVEITFEVAQGFGLELSSLLPNNLAEYPLLRQIKAYLIQGTFDPLDLVGILTGMITAYWVLHRTRSPVSSS